MTKYQIYYRKRQAAIRDEAIEFQHIYFSGECPDWDWVNDWCDYFTKYGKRFGLMQEFRENAII